MSILLGVMFRFVIPLTMLVALFQFIDFLDDREKDTQWRQRPSPPPHTPSRPSAAPVRVRRVPGSPKCGSDCAGKRISL